MPAETPKPISDPFTPDELMAIQHHPAWDDGREGFLWCRFDSHVLTPEGDPRRLRAEITWDDNDEPRDPDSLFYFDPELTIETNAVRPDGSLQTYDSTCITLTKERTLAILAADPHDLLEHFADNIAQLAVPRQSTA
jgi:hypothetical protein